MGLSEGNISACYAKGSATGKVTSSVGGLVGFNNEGTISACYSKGSARGGTRAAVGGLVGENLSNSLVSACYSAESARGGSGAVGGLVGYNPSHGPISASYFDTTTAILTVDGSVLDSKVGVGDDASSTDLGKTTTDLQSPAAYGTAGSSIYAAWNVEIDGMAGGGAPWDFGASNRYQS